MKQEKVTLLGITTLYIGFFLFLWTLMSYSIRPITDTFSTGTLLGFLFCCIMILGLGLITWVKLKNRGLRNGKET